MVSVISRAIPIDHFMWIFVVDGVFLKYAISQGTEIFVNTIITAGNHPTAGVIFTLSYNSLSNSKQ